MSSTRLNDGKNTLKVNDDLSINVKVNNFNEFDSQSDGATETKQDNQITQFSNLNNNIGSKSDIIASDNTSTWSLISLSKRISSFLESIYISTVSLISSIGNTSDAKATSETGSFSINSLLKRLSYNTRLDYDKITLGRYSPDIKTLSASGHNPAVNTSTEDIWGGSTLYTGFPTIDSVVELFSASALDTSTGTGLRTVRISGLDINYNEISEIITLNGITPVQSINRYLRCASGIGLTAGSTGTNQGIITCRHIAPNTANVFFQMPANRSITQVCARTIPAGYTGILKQYNYGIIPTGALAQDAYATFALKTSVNGVTRITSIRSSSNHKSINGTFQTGIPLVEKTDIIITIISATSTNLAAFGSFEIILYKNTL